MHRPEDVLAVILGGGRGTRLYPLTKDRAKPAVPLGGKYRLVDIPISNCLNSGVRRIFLLTQFNSHSLHRHIQNAYKFDQFGGGWVLVLAAQQTYRNATWYQGTSDAVRQNLDRLMTGLHEHVLVLSGDQLYRMDFREIIRVHLDSEAEITIAATPVDRTAATSLGLLGVDDTGRVIDFAEKPKDPAVLDRFSVPAGAGRAGEEFLASMGIYLFRKRVLGEILDNDLNDFGKDVIPNAIRGRRVVAFRSTGYWEDIGTIGAFFNANLALLDDMPPFDFFDPNWPIYTRPRYLPSSLVLNCSLRRAMLADGCKVREAQLERVLVGIRSVIRPGSHLRDVVTLGADFYDNDVLEGPWPIDADLLPLGVGPSCEIERAILDKNVRIGAGVKIRNHAGDPDIETPTYCIKDGIVVIPKNQVIPAGTVI